jgi:hypothetical protein
MSARVVGIKKLLKYWRETRRIYGEPVYGLLLCTKEPGADTLVGQFITRYAQDLNDMSGVYCVLTILIDDNQSEGQIYDRRDGDETESGLSYLHSLSISKLGSSSIYEIAHSVKIELQKMPVMLLLADPWESDEMLIYSLKDFLASRPSLETGKEMEYISQFFRVLCTSCREVGTIQKDKRLGILKKSLNRGLGINTQNVLSQIKKTGIIAQVIEGILKGMS